MTQDAMIKKKTSRQSPSNQAPEQKRVRLSPPMLPQVSMPMPTTLPPLPPLRNVTTATATATTATPTAPATATNERKLAELRRKYLADIGMVIQQLQTVLMFCPGSACPESPVPPSVVLKLVRTVQTLEKLRALLLMAPARLRRVSIAQLETVEHQIKMNLLPLATLFRSFERDNAQAASDVGNNNNKIKMERDWSQQSDTDSPRSPSGGVSVAPWPQHDWRFLSMALNMQL